MTSFYDEVKFYTTPWQEYTANISSTQIEIEDMEFNEEEQLYTYPCPCGDKFEIYVVSSIYIVSMTLHYWPVLKDDLRDGDDVARCPSCSLIIRVIYDPDEFADEEDEDGETTYQVDTSIIVS